MRPGYSAPQQGDITFSQISRAYSEAAAAQGVPPERRTSASVLLLMSKLGELAAFAAASGSGGAIPARSAFEIEELTDIIGQIAVGTCALGVGFGIDVGEAALTASKSLRRVPTPQSASLAPPLTANISNKERTPPPMGLSVPSTASMQQVNTAAGSATTGTAPPSSGEGVTPPAQAAAHTHAHAPPPAVLPPPLHIDPQSSRGANGNEQLGLDLVSPTRRSSQPPGGAAMLPAPEFSLGAPAAVHHDDEEGIDNPSLLLSGNFNNGESSADEREWERRRNETDSSAEHLLLSPKTSGSFFAMLSAIEHANFNEEQFAGLGLTYCYLKPDGGVVDVVPNGRNIYVSLRDFPKYLELVAPFRPRAPADNSSPARMYTAQLPSAYNPKADIEHCSPTHFAKGLFSPMTTATEFRLGDAAACVPEVFKHPVPANTAAAAAAPTAANNKPSVAMQGKLDQANTGAHNESFDVNSDSDSEAVRQRFVAAMSHHGGAVAQSTPDNLDEGAFWKVIDAIEAKQVPRVEELGLYFVYPSRGRLVELANNGAFIPVTQKNLPTFLSLIQEQRAVNEGHIKRVESVKTIAVQGLGTYDPRQEGRRYSPTHYSADVFAPHTNRTAFIVDYDAKHVADVLPPALQRGARTNISTAEDYVDYISANPERFKDIFQAARKDPTIVERMSVTFCMPNRPGSVVDLVPNGAQRKVQVAEVPEFLGLVLSMRKADPGLLESSPRTK